MTRVRGYSLIELVVTVAIVATLATLALPVAELVAKRDQEQQLRAALREIRQALDAYRQAGDEGRIARAAGASGYPPDLEALVEGEVDARSPDGARIYFLRRLPRDPMHPDRAVGPAETWGTRSYASAPDDPQPGEDVFDVYSLSDGVGLNGIPYREW